MILAIAELDGGMVCEVVGWLRVFVLECGCIVSLSATRVAAPKAAKAKPHCMRTNPAFIHPHTDTAHSHTTTIATTFIAHTSASSPLD